MTRIICFGDSITWGANDLEMGGWPSRIRHYFDNTYAGGPSVYNLGISGEKTAELLARLEREITVRRRGRELIIIIAIGINDSLHKPHSKPTALKEFEKNYTKLVDKALHVGKVVLLTPTNVDDSHPLATYRNKDIEPYVKIIRRVASTKSIKLVNVFGIITKDDLKTDGLHPEASGHQKIADAILAEPNILLSLKQSNKTLLSSANLYCDGGSRGNPGPSAGAFLICKTDDTVVEKSGFYIGITTNNQAEYQALIHGLQRTATLGISNLNVFMDSELIVKQLKGLYKIKNLGLQPLYKSAKDLIEKFETISFTHVPRVLNNQADEEVNRILDEHQKSSV